MLVTRLFVSFVICLVFTTAYAFCRVIDDEGQTVYLEKPAHRVISLAPDITELLFAVGAAQQIVGVVYASDFPISARKILRVGCYNGIDLERIVALKPDLVVTWHGMFKRQLSILKSLKIPVYTTHPQKLNDISRAMKNLSCLVGHEQMGDEAAARFSSKLIELKKAYAKKKTVSVFYQIGSYSLFTINKESWINEVIMLCGGQNIFADAKSIALEVSWEAIIVANPQVIVSDALNPNWRKRWEHWPQVTAVQKKLLFNIPPDLLDRAGPRLLEGASLVCKNLEQARASL